MTIPMFRFAEAAEIRQGIGKTEARLCPVGHGVQKHAVAPFRVQHAAGAAVLERNLERTRNIDRLLSGFGHP